MSSPPEKGIKKVGRVWTLACAAAFCECVGDDGKSTICIILRMQTTNHYVHSSKPILQLGFAHYTLQFVSREDGIQSASSSFGHNTPHTSPKIASRTPPSFPRIRIHNLKCILQSWVPELGHIRRLRAVTLRLIRGSARFIQIQLQRLR